MIHVNDDLLNEYLDNSLDDSRHQEAAEHLAGCAACAQRLVELQLLFVALENVPDLTLDVDLSASVVTQIKAERRGWLAPRRLTAILAIQALVVLAAVVWLWPNANSFLQDRVQTVTNELISWIQPGLADQLQQDWVDQVSLVTELVLDIQSEMANPAAPWLLITGLVLLPWLIANGLVLGRGRGSGYQEENGR